MLVKLNNRLHYQARIIRNRYHWRVIADEMHPILAALMAIVDCGDLLMHSLLYGRLN